VISSFPFEFILRRYTEVKEVYLVHLLNKAESWGVR